MTMKRFAIVLKAVADVFRYWHACASYDWWLFVGKMCLVIGGRAMARVDQAKLTLQKVEKENDAN